MSETVTIKDQISFTNVKESDANHFLRLLMTSHIPRGSICQLKSTFLETRTDLKLFQCVRKRNLALRTSGQRALKW